MHRYRIKGLGYACAATVAFGVAALAMRRMTFGDVDPLGAGIGLLSLGVGAAALVVAVRTWWMQQSDAGLIAERLAAAVRDIEQRARRQLLGGPVHPVDVRFDVHPWPTHHTTNAPRQGRLSEVAELYQKLRPRRMVITGDAGAGKTVLAVELMMMLLENRTDKDPVPVRLSASSLDLPSGPQQEPDADAQRMRQWLVAHLTEVYRLPPRSARALVDAGLVLPVVDGLDELDATGQPDYASRAGQALRIFNSHVHYRHRAPLIVTCRSSHYQALISSTTGIQDAALLEIRPMTPAQAHHFIATRAVDATRWWPVLDRIDRDQRDLLAAGLTTPWRLTLALTAYEQRGPAGEFLRDPHELTSPALNTPDKIRDHLLALFIPAALHSTPNHPYDPARAHRWLAVLARHLHHNAQTGHHPGGRPRSGTDITLHELWPLAGDRRPRLIAFALLVPLWLTMLSDNLVALPHTSGLLVLAAVVGFGVHRAWTRKPPKPRRLNLHLLRTRHGRRRVAVTLTMALAIEIANSLQNWAGDTNADGPWSHATTTTEALISWLLLGLTDGLLLGLAGGLALGIMDLGDIATTRPWSIVRDDLALGLAFGTAFGIRGGAGSMIYALAQVEDYGYALSEALAGFGSGLRFGILVGLAFAVGTTGLRYGALLVCTRRWTRRWLPWRLGRFLDVCYRAGLIRIAGAGYQFRHRELQDYLTGHRLAAAHQPHTGPQDGHRHRAG